MKSVTVYTMESCYYCKQALEFLKSKGVAYRTVSIDDLEGRREWSKLGSHGVPTFVVGETVLTGFDENRLKALLNIS